MIITISGLPGSGTTTVGEMLSKEIGYQFTSAGEIFRATAKEYGLTLETLTDLAKSNPKYDTDLDQKQIALLREADNLVLEGRLSAYHTVHAVNGFTNKKRFLRVLLTAGEGIRAGRISRREPNEELYVIYEKMRHREEAEKLRYDKFYNIDVADTSIYDIVIPTDIKAPDEIVAIIRSVAGSELILPTSAVENETNTAA